MPSSSPELDSEALFHACGSSDAVEQANAFQQLWTYLYRLAHNMTRAQPDGDALAQDCAQRALVRIHEQRESCREPKAFRSWCRRIVSNLVIDELRRRKRFAPSEVQEKKIAQETADLQLESDVLETLTTRSLRNLLQLAPISDRSRRVVVGRYLDEQDDKALADAETKRAATAVPVLPSHVQVTRSKNISKLKKWPALRNFLLEGES